MTQPPEKTPKMSPDIYQYDDFRAFLKACFEAKVASEKEAGSKYSQRQFARDAGFANPGYFNDVLKAFKPLSENAVEKMAGVFGLKAHETEFLKLLAAYGQAKDHERKDALYKRITARRNRSKFTRLNPALSRYYQDVRYALVRGAVEVLDFRGNYDALAAFLDPPLPVAVVKVVVRDLCEWGLVEQGADGRYRTTRSIVEPSPSLAGMSRAMNAEWLMLAREALHRVPKENRHISTMIVNISEALHAEILERIERFREEIFKRVEDDASGPRTIQQLTMAYVPRSRVKP
jgi:uncharacterized protein (TIGR02147 family)